MLYLKLLPISPLKKRQVGGNKLVLPLLQNSRSSRPFLPLRWHHFHSFYWPSVWYMQDTIIYASGAMKRQGLVFRFLLKPMESFPARVHTRPSFTGGVLSPLHTCSFTSASWGDQGFFSLLPVHTMPLFMLSHILSQSVQSSPPFKPQLSATPSITSSWSFLGSWISFFSVFIALCFFGYYHTLYPVLTYVYVFLRKSLCPFKK